MTTQVSLAAFYQKPAKSAKPPAARKKPTASASNSKCDDLMKELQKPGMAYQMNCTPELLRRLALENVQNAVGEIEIPPQDQIKASNQEITARMADFRKGIEERKAKLKKGIEIFSFDVIENQKLAMKIKNQNSLPPDAVNELVPQIDRFDWRLTGFVSPVRDQGECNSCWAFAATEAFESRLMYNLNRFKVIPFQNRNTKRMARGFKFKVATLSVQGVLDCVAKVKGNCGTGGFPTHAFDHFVQNGARVLHTRHSQNINQEILGVEGGVCTENEKAGLKAIAWDFVFDDPRTTPTTDDEIRKMKLALLEHGPLVVHLTKDKRFEAYLEGIFDERNPEEVNHAVLLTGWDDKLKAWIIQNTFGTNWGASCVTREDSLSQPPIASFLKSQRGCMYIAYGANNVGKYAAWIEAPFEIPADLLRNK